MHLTEETSEDCIFSYIGQVLSYDQSEDEVHLTVETLTLSISIVSVTMKVSYLETMPDYTGKQQYTPLS